VSVGRGIGEFLAGGGRWAGVVIVDEHRDAVARRLLRNIASALHVEPFELLNHEPEDDDVGYVIERMASGLDNSRDCESPAENV